MKIHYDVSGMELTGELQKYAHRKVTHLAKRLPQGLRTEADCRVELTQLKRANVSYNTCGLTLAFGDTELTAEETTQHMYAAMDIASVQIEQQLRDFLTRGHSRLRERLRGRLKTEWPIV